MSWDRKLWGVIFKGSLKQDRPMLLGAGWHRDAQLGVGRYHGEPTRALLFDTRKQARKWCAEQQAKYAGRDDFVALWKFKPVKVRETVEEV